MDRKFSVVVNEQTPVRVSLQPGDYNIVVIGPKGESKSQQVKIGPDAPGSYVPVFEAVDVENLVRTN